MNHEESSAVDASTSVSVVPAIVPCDFHPGHFKPDRWNQRTCPDCAATRAPDQSLLTWGRYQDALRDWQRARGTRPTLTEAQLAFRDRGSRTRFPAGKRPAGRLSPTEMAKMPGTPSTEKIAAQEVVR